MLKNFLEVLGKNKSFIFLIILTTFVGIFFRVYHIEFGLPHSFYADEPEIAEPAINYTYEFKDIIKNNNYFKLIPVSYVYGTFPSYLYTVGVMIFSKTLNVLHIDFTKETLYIFMRTVNALISFLIAPIVALLYYKLFKNKLGSVLVFTFLALNWKFIVMAHYVNADVLITSLLGLSFLLMYYEFTNENDTRFTVLSAIVYGLAVGTKITVLITLPLYIYLFIQKKEYRNAVAFCFIVFGTFCITNPFSLIFIQDFTLRIYEMFFKEGGMVFDSVDTNPIKYVLAIFDVVSMPLLAISLYGKINSFKARKNINFHIFLLLNILIYFIFYTLQQRRVDRWLLPIIPLIIIYAATGIIDLRKRFGLKITSLVFVPILFIYLNNPIKLLADFQRDTPKSAAYQWVQKNLPLLSTKLIYTEEGLDPMKKIPEAKVVKFNVYESEGASLEIPKDTNLYEYIIISSRVMQNYKRSEVVKEYPQYAARWLNFEQELQNKQKFELIKTFTLPSPNLIPLSNVYIYKNLNYLPKGNL